MAALKKIKAKIISEIMAVINPKNTSTTTAVMIPVAIVRYENGFR